MRTVLLVVLAVMLFVVPAVAEETDRGIYTTPSSGLTDWLNDNDDFYHRHAYNVPDTQDWVLGAKVDAPNLIRLTKNVTIGVEVTKDVNDTNFDEGWAAYGKLTYAGSLIDISKK